MPQYDKNHTALSNQTLCINSGFGQQIIFRPLFLKHVLKLKNVTHKSRQYFLQALISTFSKH